MREVLLKLIELQKIDSRLDTLRARRGDFPERLKKQRIHAESLEADIKKENARYQEIEKEIKRLNAEIEDVKVKLAKYREQLYLVTTNKEYDALQYEMDVIKEIINKNENSILELEEEKIELEESIKRNTISFENTMKDIEKSQVQLDKALAETTDEEEKLIPQREACVSKIDPQYLNTYNRFRKRRNGHGIIQVKRSACGSCYYHLPPQTMIEIRNMDKFMTCPNCGIYLYWEE